MCDVNMYTAPPSAPTNVMVMNVSHVESFSIILSWDPPLDDVLVDSYRILTNTTTHPLSTTNYTVVLEGKYNIPQQITLSAINCAGSSEVVTKEVLVGEYYYVVKPYIIIFERGGRERGKERGRGRGRVGGGEGEGEREVEGEGEGEGEGRERERGRGRGREGETGREGGTEGERTIPYNPLSWLLSSHSTCEWQY